MTWTQVDLSTSWQWIQDYLGTNWSLVQVDLGMRWQGTSWHRYDLTGTNHILLSSAQTMLKTYIVAIIIV